MEFNMNLKIFS